MRKLGLLLGLAAVACTAYGASPQFTYADIAAGKFAQRTVAGLRSMADGEHYTVLDSGRVVVFSYASGDREGVLASPEDIGAAWQRIADYRLSPAEDKVLFRLDGKPLYRRSAYSSYVVYDTESGEAAPLHESDSLRYAVFSPDGERVAFVLRNNIYVKELATGRETAVTTDGVPNHIINGMPDWVYEEEWGLEDALRWSPDGEKLAFLRFDESGVRDYSLDLYGPDGSTPEDDVTAPRYPRRFTYKYPMAGEANSAVSLHVYDLASGRTTHVDVGPERDQYLPFFGWTPAGALCFYRINRLQNHLEVFVDDLKGTRKMIYEERSDKYIDNIGMGTVTFLSDGDRFIVKNETRTGFSHLYMYSMERGVLYPLTEGEWEVRSLVCATDERVWFLSNETSPLRNNLYVVGTNGKGKRRLTKGEGTYAIAPSEGCKYYISYFSNSSTPNTVTLHDSRGRLLRTLEDNAELKEYIASVGYPVREFFTFPVTHEGRRIELNCYIVKPADFDPGGSYPVLFTQYSGPASQQVLDRWFVDWEDALVQQGYLVVCMDPRGTGGRGEWFKKLTYGQMGLLETEDQIALARYVAGLPYVDASRIGIYGWSYGGFMSLNCILKGADVFSMAISVAPVTSWRYYDSVYTERVNGLPQENPDGYDIPSPVYYADRLKGRLLLMHGSADDNVHPQNSYKMAYELVRAGKKFDMMIYPDDNHSMVPNGRFHVRQKMVDYCLENL